jgi:hypothetical protein
MSSLYHAASIYSELVMSSAFEAYRFTIQYILLHSASAVELILFISFHVFSYTTSPIAGELITKESPEDPFLMPKFLKAIKSVANHRTVNYIL